MFACNTCESLYQLAGQEKSGRRLQRTGCDDRRSVLRDPVWKAIQAEASAEADREPVLRPLLERTVLHRHSFEDGLAILLSLKLQDAMVDESRLYAEFGEVLSEDRTIGRSAKRDLCLIREQDPATDSWLHPLINFKGFLATESYRMAHALWQQNRRSLALWVQGRASNAFGVDIHPAAKIGEGIFIDHATGVVIGETATVGDNVTILHGVTLGATGKTKGDRHPKVGRDVFIGAGAQLLGNIVIGDGAQIGAGSVVLGNVPADTTVAGVPARVVREPRATIPISEGAAETEMAVSIR